MTEKKKSALEMLAQVMAAMSAQEPPSGEKPVKAPQDLKTIYVAPPAGR